MKINKILFISILIIPLFSSAVFAGRLHPEKEYQAVWCNSHKGIMEYVLPDKTRVDCLTSAYAVEFDFADKWAECVGQALYYGLQTNKAPVCVFITENGSSDTKYLNRINRVCPAVNLKVITITPGDLH